MMGALELNRRSITILRWIDTLAPGTISHAFTRGPRPLYSMKVNCVIFCILGWADTSTLDSIQEAIFYINTNECQKL
jgi:hypothetical protein